MRWITSQIGAREHYAVPRVLYRAGKLERLYTDFWATAPWRLAAGLLGKKSLAGRYHRDLSAAPVTGFNLSSLKISRQRFVNPYDGFLEVGEAFGRRVVAALQSSSFHRPAPSSQIFFSYDTGFLEPARWVKERGGKAIVCQMDPARYEVDLVKEEEKRWPGWEKQTSDVPEAYFQRREQEWAVADLVVVNSEWSRQALMKQGVSDEKIVVVPLAYEVGVTERNLKPETGNLKKRGLDSEVSNRDAVSKSNFRSPPSSFTQKQPLRVLFLGQVILRKGIQYLIEAARLLEKESIHFDIVGPIGISQEAVASAPSNMTFHGPVSRDRTEEFYRNADLFVLPTLSDGFALTQLEAMAHGLPVIATPSCGEVVSDGSDGLIVPSSDANALAEAFQLSLPR